MLAIQYLFEVEFIRFNYFTQLFRHNSHVILRCAHTYYSSYVLCISLPLPWQLLMEQAIALFVALKMQLNISNFGKKRISFA